jgi:hypothetical protein
MKLKGFVVAAVAFALAGQAQAHEIDFSFTSTSGPSVTATLDLFTADIPVGGPYAITSITGEVSGPSGGPFSVSDINTSYGSPDNLLAASTPYLDFAGLAVDTAGGPSYNFYFQGGSYTVINTVSNPVGTGTGNASTGTATFTPVVPTPEPGTLLMLASGLIGVAVTRRRGRRRSDCTS